MTQPTIEQIREAVEAATKGPWAATPVLDGATTMAIETPDGDIAYLTLSRFVANARLIAMAPYLVQMVLDCSPFIKDHETPAQRLESNHKEALTLMGLLAEEKRHTEAWVKAARDAEAERDALKAKLDEAVGLIARDTLFKEKGGDA